MGLLVAMVGCLVDSRSQAGSHEAIEVLIDAKKNHVETCKTSSPKYPNKDLRAAALNIAANMIVEYVPKVTYLNIMKIIRTLKNKFSRERMKLARYPHTI